MNGSEVADRQLEALLERLDRLAEELARLNRRQDAREELTVIAHELRNLNESLQAIAYAALGQQVPQVAAQRGGEQGSRLARNLYCGFEVRHCLGLFRDVLDVVFENEKIGFTFAGQADEGLVVILDDADDFLSVFQLDSNRRRILDQLFEILGLFKGLFRRACGFS